MIPHPNPNPGPARRGDVCVTLPLGRYESVGDDRHPERVARWVRICRALDGTAIEGDTWDALRDVVLARLQELALLDELVSLDYAPEGQEWSPVAASSLVAHLASLTDPLHVEVRQAMRRAAALAFVLAFGMPATEGE
jgi:hypothetical protein